MAHTTGVSLEAPDWNDLPAALERPGAVTKLNKLFSTDGQYIAFTTTDAITVPVTFGIKSAASLSTVLITVSNGTGKATVGSEKDALFTLSALPYQWREFFKPTPTVPYQSFWGMFGSRYKFNLHRIYLIQSSQ